MNNLLFLQKYCSDRLSELLMGMDGEIALRVNELRIRRGGYLIIVIRNTSYFSDYSGNIYDVPPHNAAVVEPDEFDRLFMELCSYSVHSNMESLKRGYITIEGGIRIGVSSSAVYDGGRLISVKDINSLNIRIPREVRGCSRRVLDFLYVSSFPSIIIAGKPNSGKTTLLRDMARELSSGFNNKYRKLAVVDERQELGGTGSGRLDLGINTDLISGFSKKSGIELAIRSLSPEMIICDEVSTLDEVNAITYGFSSGVSFALSVHISDKSELKDKQVLRELLCSGEFSFIVLLEEYTYNVEIIDVSEVQDENNRGGNAYFLNNGSGLCRL